MARWVTIKPEAFPFDYRVRDANGKPTGAWLQFNADGPGDTGERYVPDDQADFIIKRSYGVEGKASATSTTKSRKGKTTRRKTVKKAADAKAADTGSDASVAHEAVAAADSAGDRNGVDKASG